MVIITVEELDATAVSTAMACDLQGRVLATATLSGTTGSLPLQGRHGVVIITVATPAGLLATKVIL